MDYHEKMPQMPPQAMQQMAGDIKAGKADQFGTKPINVFVGKGGQGYCLCEAPNADAVMKSHQSKGFTMSHKDVIEVQTLV